MKSKRANAKSRREISEFETELRALTLSPQEWLFVDRYVANGGNGTRAAISAGYSPNSNNLKSAGTTASRLLTRDGIRSAIYVKTRQAIVKLDITEEYILDGLKEVFDRCMARVPVMTKVRAQRGGGVKFIQKTDETTGEGIWRFNAAGATKALELLGKYKVMFTERVEIEDTTKYGDRLTAALARRKRFEELGESDAPTDELDPAKEVQELM